MSKDSDDLDLIDEQQNKKPDDFLTMIVEKTYNIDWLIYIAIAIAFLIVVSDTFGENVLARFPGALNDRGDLTTRGYSYQLVSLLIGTLVGRTLLSFK